MITVEGAALIAQIYALGVITLALEIRGVDDLFATGKQGLRSLWYLGVGLVVAVLFGLTAVSLCVTAVAMNRPLGAVESVIVGIAGMLLFAATGNLLVFLIGQRFGFWERLGKRAMENVKNDPEEVLRRQNFIEEHHPNAPRLTPELRALLEQEAAEARSARERGESEQNAIPRPSGARIPDWMPRRLRRPRS